MSDDAGLGVASEFEGFRGDAMHNPWPPYYQIIIAKCISKTWHTGTPLFFASFWLWYAARILREWRTSGRPGILGAGSVAVVITLCRRPSTQRAHDKIRNIYYNTKNRVDTTSPIQKTGKRITLGACAVRVCVCTGTSGYYASQKDKRLCILYCHQRTQPLYYSL